jgi:hypothetical protein
MGELAIRSKTIDYMGRQILICFDDDKLVSLTDIWIGAGRPENSDPGQWLRSQHAKSFIASLATRLNMQISHIKKTVRGKGLARGLPAGSYAHWQVALEYAGWISHEFRQLIHEAFREWVEEQYDPGLKLERGIDLFHKMEKDDEWIQSRFDGIGSRKALMHEVKMRNGDIGGMGAKIYPAITDAMSVALSGHTTAERKASLGLDRKANLRNHMSRQELAETSLSELLARERIVLKGADGGQECLEHSVHATRAVKKVRELALA